MFSTVLSKKMTRFLYASSLLLLSFFSNLDTCNSNLRCEHTLLVNGKPTASECTGDFCVSQISHLPNGESSTIKGCVSGFDAVKPGCFNEVDGKVSCVCNDTDLCNANVTKITYEPAPEVECYEGNVVDGKLVGNNRCKGTMCFLTSRPVRGGKESEMSAYCGGVSAEQTQPDNNVGCLYTSNGEGVHDSWECRCHTKLCNLHSIKTPKASNKVKCSFGLPMPSGPSTPNATCTGDFCMLTPVDPSTNLYVKGCVSLSNGAQMNPKVAKLELGPASAEIYFCNEDDCNKDVDHAMWSIFKSNNNKTEI